MPDQFKGKRGAVDPWALDLEQMREKGPTRWIVKQLDELKDTLNARHLSIVSDAIGSLEFDKVELQHRITFLENGIRAAITRVSTGEETIWSLLKKELVELFKEKP